MPVRITSDVAAIGRMFKAVDAIDAEIARRVEAFGVTLPTRGHLSCPNCKGQLVYVQLTAIKGAARCSTAGCVDFAASH